jgi:hypothetical protein
MFRFACPSSFDPASLKLRRARKQERLLLSLTKYQDERKDKRIERP